PLNASTALLGPAVALLSETTRRPALVRSLTTERTRSTVSGRPPYRVEPVSRTDEGKDCHRHSPSAPCPKHTRRANDNEKQRQHSDVVGKSGAHLGSEPSVAKGSHRRELHADE